MWQSNNQRGKGYQKKRFNTNKRGASFKLKRTEISLKVIPEKLGAPGENHPIQGRIVLNDMSTEGLSLFLKEPVLVGDSVALTLEHPKQIYLKARVVFCQEVGSSQHIISVDPYYYHIGVRFVFENEQQKIDVQKFCEEMIMGELTPQKVAA